MPNEPEREARRYSKDAMKTLTVALAERSYPIHIGANLLARAAELLPVVRVTKLRMVDSNPTVAAHHLAPLQRALTRAVKQTP